ncbi:hypothetical protein [Clostridium tagluense]|uniref:hypothetical protein n=1 Tax=Clostridium tagluense TaxID=360422 RepID=UPI001CF26EA7|nr:hypothetical protein [Clostridium tagluense]MCB2297057.1 hypothetical protein [Clostridium tagluense]
MYKTEKYKYKYNGHAPSYIWSNRKEKTFGTFEDMIEDWIKSSKERNKGVQREFISSNELSKLAIKRSKYLKSKNKQED